MRAGLRNGAIESFLRSFACSAMLSLSCAVLAAPHAWALLHGFDVFELLHLAYNVTVAFFLLIRTQPSVVSMNLLHWIVAVVTSISGFFFVRNGSGSDTVLIFVGDGLIGISVFFSLVAAVVLGRSFDVLPALRPIKTRCVYQIVRHPIYLFAIVLRIGYVLKNPLIYNGLLLLAVAILYDRRARYEEDILSHDGSYVEYIRQVKYRFVPGVY
jgi:protein-S-isoprenylcysteine O-methyltransferase Ste14